ncbi:MAG: hypothetical protein ABH881_04445 [bacterium]
MTTKYSGVELRKRFIGKEVPQVEKIKEYFKSSPSGLSTSRGVKEKLAGSLAGKSQLGRNEVLKKMGLDSVQRSRIEKNISGGQKTLHQIAEEKKAVEKLERRNVALSQMAREESGRTADVLGGGEYVTASSGARGDVGSGSNFGKGARGLVDENTQAKKLTKEITTGFAGGKSSSNRFATRNTGGAGSGPQRPLGL